MQVDTHRKAIAQRGHQYAMSLGTEVQLAERIAEAADDFMRAK